TATAASPRLAYVRGPMPDSVRMSYMQQKLPIRNQSLAAFGPQQQQQQQQLRAPSPDPP
ncbi:hypothetical protein BC940DRAFT_229373, partial [Gongronella butleri]